MEKKFLDGNELEGKITVKGQEIGGYAVDVDESGMIKSSVNAEHSVNQGAISFGGSLYLKVDAKKLLAKVASKLPLVGQLFAAQSTTEDGKQ